MILKWTLFTVFSARFLTTVQAVCTDFAKTNQNEVVQIHTNFFDNFRIRKLICENEFGILNLEKKINDSKFIKIICENKFKKETEFEHKL